MPAPSPTPPPRRLVPALAALLLAVFAALCLHIASDTSPTFDEPDQVAVGYASLTQGPEHPYSVINLRLSQLWAALPLLAFDPPPAFPSVEQQEAATAEGINFGRLFFFANGNDPEAMLLASRAMIVLLGVALGLVLFQWARRLHGDFPALLTLTLYALSPLVIANSAVATTEIATTLFFTLAVLTLWRLLHRVTVGRIALAGLAVGALAATKISGLLIVPMAAAMLVVRLRGGRPLEIRFPGRPAPAPRPATAGVLLGALLAAGLVAWATVWAIYGGPAAAPPSDPAAWSVQATHEEHPGTRIIAAFRAAKLLPEAYLFDLHQFVHSGDIRRAFLLGEYSVNGWWYFFPVAWLVKNPLPFLLALGAGLVVAWRAWRGDAAGRAALKLYELTPLLALGAIYGGFSLLGNLNIGARHLLPVFPLALIVAGLAVRLPLANPRLRAAFLGALFAGSALELALVYPYPISYFNVFAGGPARGYRVLSDSSADWGESLPQVQRWLERRAAAGDASKIHFSYFGCADLAHYGIDDRTAVLLPQFYDTRPIRPYSLGPGSYVIGTTMLNCIYNGHFMGPWRASYEARYQELLREMPRFQAAMREQGTLDELLEREGAELWMTRLSDFDYLRFGRLCAYLRRRAPDDRVTYGTVVYEVTLEDLHAALGGPPPELRPADAIKGADRYADDELDFVK